MALKLRGINYDTGTEYVEGHNSRSQWNFDDLSADLDSIQAELHCNAVNFYGTDPDRILDAAREALTYNLTVFAQLRNINRSMAATRSAVLDFATKLSDLGASDRLVLNIGCEFSVFTSGFLPGKTFHQRMSNLTWFWPFLPFVNARVSRYVGPLAAEIREIFPGKITYSSGAWEQIDWKGFDYAGVNLYEDKENEDRYGSIVRGIAQAPLPTLVTEFGCCTYSGASRLGGGGWTVVDHRKQPARLKRMVERNEQEQADLLVESLELFVAANIHGCFVFDFLESQHPYSDDPLFDLDRASYGIVCPKSTNGRIVWTKKKAFDAVAGFYGRATGSSRSALP